METVIGPGRQARPNIWQVHLVSALAFLLGACGASSKSERKGILTVFFPQKAAAPKFHISKASCPLSWSRSHGGLGLSSLGHLVGAPWYWAFLLPKNIPISLPVEEIRMCPSCCPCSPQTGESYHKSCFILWTNKCWGKIFQDRCLNTCHSSGTVIITVTIIYCIVPWEEARGGRGALKEKNDLPWNLLGLASLIFSHH